MSHPDRRARAVLRSLAAIGLATAASALAADGPTILEQQCAACHGKSGVSSETMIPTIAGYSAKYIVDSIGLFKKKTRTCAEVTIPSGPKKGSKSDMCKVVANLGDEDIEAVARHLSGLKFVRAKQPFDAAKAQKGTSVYKLRCEKCHEDNGASPSEDNGILAGQWMPYLREQLIGFRAGKRPIDDKMKQRLDRVTKDEEDALLHFFASQQ